jgi:hypothetical protein
MTMIDDGRALVVDRKRWFYDGGVSSRWQFLQAELAFLFSGFFYGGFLFVLLVLLLRFGR